MTARPDPIRRPAGDDDAGKVIASGPAADSFHIPIFFHKKIVGFETLAKGGGVPADNYVRRMWKVAPVSHGNSLAPWSPAMKAAGWPAA
jgi:hypothetical protein